MRAAADRVRAALAFEPVVVVGITFTSGDTTQVFHSERGPESARIEVTCGRLQPDFMFVSASDPQAAEIVEAMAACGTAPLWMVGGPLGTVAHRDGWFDALKLTASDPDSISQLMDEVMPILVEQVTRGAALGATAIVIADDLAGADGPLVAPDFALECIVPRIGRLAEVAAEHSTPAIFHSDGDVRWLLPSLRGQGFAAVHPGGLSDPAFDIFVDTANAVGLVVLGGVSSETLHAGRSEVLRAASKAAARAAGGGLLIADDGGLTTYEQLVALISALHVARMPWRHQAAGLT